MSIYDRQYDLYVMLGNPAAEPAWAEPVWRTISSALDPLIQSARDKAAVRSTQLKPGPGSPRAISFGRIGWNERGHKKWIHSSGAHDTGIVFISSEVWAPSWTICKREGCLPDTYFAIRNAQLKPEQQVSFNPVVLLAVALDQSSHLLEQGRESAETIAQTLSSVLRVQCKRPWGYRSGEIYTNGIGYLTVSGLFKPGPRHQGEVSVSLLNGTWETF